MKKPRSFMIIESTDFGTMSKAMEELDLEVDEETGLDSCNDKDLPAWMFGASGLPIALSMFAYEIVGRRIYLASGQKKPPNKEEFIKKVRKDVIAEVSRGLYKASSIKQKTDIEVAAAFISYWIGLYVKQESHRRFLKKGVMITIKEDFDGRCRHRYSIEDHWEEYQDE